MNKKQAAEYLGISTRALERHVSLGHAGVRYVKGRTGDEAFFDETELRQLKAQIDSRKAPRASVTQDTGELAPESSALVRGSDSGLSMLKALIEATQEKSNERPAASVGEKIMLTLTDAAALTSLSAGHLRAAIHAGKLKGKIIGRGYKIKRDDLNAYVKKL
jgi:excisionase family DNA binding protein